jgi:hypothetical protein
MGRACSRHWERGNGYKMLVGKPERKRPLGRLRYRWVDNIKIDRREIGWGGMDWTDLAQDMPVEGSCEHGFEPSGSIKCWEILKKLSDWWFSRRAQFHGVS